MSRMASGISRGIAVLTGLALVAIPVVPVVVIIFGWSNLPVIVTMIAILASPLLLAGYVFQIVIARTGFLRSDGLFITATNGARRGIIAAWLVSAGLLFVPLLLIGGAAATVLATLLALAWIGGWGWLVVEWIRQFTASKACRRAGARGM